MQKFPRKLALDTGPILALIAANDPDHHACQKVLKRLPETTTFISTESCLTEVSWLLPNNRQARAKFSQLLKILGVQIFNIDDAAIERIFELQDRYEKLPMDFADASIVVACERFQLEQVFTLDRRDFSVYVPSHTKYFKLLP